MTRRFLLIALVPALLLVAAEPPATVASDAVALVDPRIGTGGAGFGVGSAYPGAALPFGAVALSPDTTFNGLQWGFAHCGGYWHADPQIRGFTHTHIHGTGIPDLGAVLVMPTVGTPVAPFDERAWRSDFDHARERAEAGYYAVRLDRHGIDAELTATEWTGVHRYRFPARGTPVVLVAPGHLLGNGRIRDGAVEIDPRAREVRGFVDQRGEFTSLTPKHDGIVTYFVARFERPFASYGTWTGGVPARGRDRAEGPDAGAYLAFDEGDPAPVVLAVGISFQSIEQAAANLAAQAADLDFDRVRADARARWAGLLAAVRVEGGTPAERRIFATALYHSFLMPTDWTETGGRYRGFDGRVHDAEGRRYYTNFSLWDTFRTQHPLITLLFPDRESDMMESLVRMTRQGGVVPMWPLGDGETFCMVGDPAAIVYADSYLKGARDFDARAAYESVRAKASGEAKDGGREGIEDYLARGYVCEDRHRRGTSLTTEYAYADGALAAWAEAMGNAADAATFRARAGNWRNHFDPATGFLRARRCDGRFARPFLPRFVFSPDYTEGTAWQWTWYVPHDAAGLVAAFGSREAFVRKLTEHFERGARARDTIFPDVYYWHGNEPGLFAPYLFLYAGRPDLTQKWVRWAMAEKYADAPDGLDGNDDAGTLSAWYVFSALGVFPVAGSDVYALGSPLFDRMVVRLPKGELVVTAENNGPANVFVQSAAWNGRPLAAPFLRHADLAAGGTLEFVMGPNPSSWGRIP